mgnify:CR=1 FL=1
MVDTSLHLEAEHIRNLQCGRHFLVMGKFRCIAMLEYQSWNKHGRVLDGIPTINSRNQKTYHLSETDWHEWWSHIFQIHWGGGLSEKVDTMIMERHPKHQFILEISQVYSWSIWSFVHVSSRLHTSRHHEESLRYTIYMVTNMVNPA